jgi:hypothetical protein
MSDSKKIKILDAIYNKESSLIQLKIKEVETEKELVWALSGESFDSMVNQLTGSSLTFSAEQREELLPHIREKEFNCEMSFDMKEEDLSSLNKNVSDKEWKNLHDVLDKYPFFEVSEELNKEKQDEN